MTSCFSVLQLHRSVKDGMLNDLKNEYEFDNAIGKAWNRVQVRVSGGAGHGTGYK